MVCYSHLLKNFPQFVEKMGTIKDRNGMDLTEAEILRRVGKNPQKNYTKNDLYDPNNHNGVITHLDTTS